MAKKSLTLQSTSRKPSNKSHHDIAPGEWMRGVDTRIGCSKKNYPTLCVIEGDKNGL